MSSKEIKAQAQARRAAEKLQAAIQNGLSLDKSDIKAEPVFKDLAEGSIPSYETMMVHWWAYLKEFPGSDPRKMEDMKHFAEFIGRSTKPRLVATPTVKSIRRKKRTFMSAWQRETKLAIPKDVHDSMAPYIMDKLRKKIGLSTAERPPTYLTIELYVNMKEFAWQRDSHNYLHEGTRVIHSCLLNMHCYSSGRLQEICMSLYKVSFPSCKSCNAVLDSESAAWHHLRDVHSIHKPVVGAKRRAPDQETEDESPKTVKKPRVRRNLKSETPHASSTPAPKQESPMAYKFVSSGP